MSRICEACAAEHADYDCRFCAACSEKRRITHIAAQVDVVHRTGTNGSLCGIPFDDFGQGHSHNNPEVHPEFPVTCEKCRRLLTSPGVVGAEPMRKPRYHCFEGPTSALCGKFFPGDSNSFRSQFPTDNRLKGEVCPECLAAVATGPHVSAGVVTVQGIASTMPPVSIPNVVELPEAPVKSSRFREPKHAKYQAHPSRFGQLRAPGERAAQFCGPQCVCNAVGIGISEAPLVIYADNEEDVP